MVLLTRFHSVVTPLRECADFRLQYTGHKAEDRYGAYCQFWGIINPDLPEPLNLELFGRDATWDNVQNKCR